MIFWRTEFAPKVPGDKFDKEYAYNIRHNYGEQRRLMRRGRLLVGFPLTPTPRLCRQGGQDDRLHSPHLCVHHPDGGRL